ncbi:MAG: hypothetical protein M1482_08125 [Chloroflexi bacterium]|nr:hypothetical protein [Chloroflexota bacterium]
MSKSRKKHAVPSFPAFALLRPHLDELWNNPALPQQADAEIQTALDQLARGVKPALLLPALIRSFQSAPADARARVNALLPEWLRMREHVPALVELIANGRVDAELLETANAWVAASGVNLPQPFSAPVDLFFQAYGLDNEMQATIIVLWYVNQKKNRLHGMGFLVDHNPPWDGAVKDVVIYPKLNSRDMQQRYIDTWTEHGDPLTAIERHEAKIKILNALNHNRDSKIRLPRDLIANRNAFGQFVLALPDASDTPAFTAADWEFLSQNGQTPEGLSHNERKHGFRTRTKEGEEILIRPDFDLDGVL